MTKKFFENIATFQNFSEFRYSEIVLFHPEIKRGAREIFFDLHEFLVLDYKRQKLDPPKKIGPIWGRYVFFEIKSSIFGVG